MKYNVKFDFVCHDEKMTGAVEKQLGEEVLRASVGELVASLKPAVLARYPALKDSIDYIELVKLSVSAVS